MTLMELIPGPFASKFNAMDLYYDSGVFYFEYYELKKPPDNKTTITSQVVSVDNLCTSESKLEIMTR